MKVFVLAIAIFALNSYVTRATSLDPLENEQMDVPKSADNDDARTKRSGDIFSSLVKKKLGLFSSLAGSSSGKSIGQPEHFEEPLSYHTKSFNLWGVKKAIMSSVLQAAKAITGGVIALKGHLLTAKGHAVVAKGKLLQTKGQAISNFGKNIATHAFDVHQEPPHYDEGLYNHLPVVPVHQPTSYGAATAFGYQQQVYPNTAYASHAYPTANGYQVAAPSSYPTGYAAQQSGYNQEYSGYGSGNGFTNKRAVPNTASESNLNQMKNDFEKDSVRAGLLIFKPIKMPQNLPQSGNSALQSAIVQNAINQRPTQSGGVFPTSNFKTTQNFDFKSLFPAFQAAQTANGGHLQSALANGYQTQPLNNGYQATPAAPNGYKPTNGYQTPQTAEGFSSFQDQGYSATLQNAGYPAQSGYRFPPTGSGSAVSVEQIPSQGYGLQNFDFAPMPSSQEFNQQLAELSGQQQQSPQQTFDGFGGGDQHNAASSSEDRVVQPTYKHVRKPEAPKPNAGRTKPESSSAVKNYFLPTTVTYDNIDSDDSAGYAKKRSTPNRSRELATTSDESSGSSSSSRESVVPLKYSDGSSVEDQARLKQTVQRFFSMLQKQP